MNKDIKNFENQKITDNYNKNLEYFKKIFSKDAVFRTREIHVKNGLNFDCAALFIDSMVNAEKFNISIIRPLLTTKVEPISKNIAAVVKKQILFNDEVTETNDVLKMIQGINLGDTVLLFSNSSTALIVNTKGWRTRGISEPNDERVQQGPREGFDEALVLNAAMLRRKLSTPDLCFERLIIGRKTVTNVFVCYLESVADLKLVKFIKQEIKKIDIDGVLDSNYINELINKNKFSLFKTAGSTERPDIVAARLLEGKVAIMVDGTPVVLTVPYVFAENFQSDDDYYLNYIYAFFGRALRYLCYNIAVMVPALYMAVTLFHPNLLPASFLISVSASRGGIPFPSFAECLILILIFEILKETGIRMQQNVGHALSIVGGLVVGQAAVDAKLVSAPLLIAVALSGIAGLMVPRLKLAVLYSKIFLVVLSSFLGIFGFFVGFTILHIHLYSLNSFGVDYVYTVTKFTKNSLKDTIVRAPWWLMIKRPYVFTKNIIRQKRNFYD